MIVSLTLGIHVTCNHAVPIMLTVCHHVYTPVWTLYKYKNVYALSTDFVSF